MKTGSSCGRMEEVQSVRGREGSGSVEAVTVSDPERARCTNHWASDAPTKGAQIAREPA